MEPGKALSGLGPAWLHALGVQLTALAEEAEAETELWAGTPSQAVAQPILTHWAMAPATLYIFKGQGSAGHPAWASQGGR